MFRVLVAVSCCALFGLSALAEDRLPADANANKPLLPAVRGMLDNLPGVSGAMSRLTGERPADEPGFLEPLLEADADEKSAEVVQVRLSKDFLQGFLERDFNRTSQVREVILGTNVAGTAKTRGATTLILHENPDKAVIEVVLKGTVQARTIGHNGPVQLHCSSISPFESRKVIHLESGGIETLPATSAANTRSTTHQIKSTLPGLRGRIAKRIAHGRIEEVRGQADAIASRNTERRLSAEFDKTVEQSLANARGAVQNKLVSLPIGDLSDDWQYRSQPEFIEMTLIDPEVSNVAPVAADFETDAAVAVRVHRSAVRGALTNNELREALRPLLISLMSEDKSEIPDADGGKILARPVVATLVTSRRHPEFRVTWSEDRKWLEFHFTPDPAPAPLNEAPAGLAITDR